MRWQVGDVRVVKVPEMVIETDVRYLLDVTGDESPPTEMEGAPTGSVVGKKGGLMLSVHGFIIESQGSVTLVDPCWGLHRDLSFLGDRLIERRDFLEELQKAGYGLNDVDRIVCTHLHHDHVGWNTRQVNGRWVPTFPGTPVVVSEHEFHEASQQEPDGYYMTFETAVRPVADAGLMELVEPGYSITPEVSLFATPGHSAGHVSVKIESNKARAVITGDIVHHPWQFEHPECAMFSDHNAAQAKTARHDFIDRCADLPIRIFGTHFPGSSSGFLVRSNGIPKFVFD